MVDNDSLPLPGWFLLLIQLGHFIKLTTEIFGLCQGQENLKNPIEQPLLFVFCNKTQRGSF